MGRIRRMCIQQIYTQRVRRVHTQVRALLLQLLPISRVLFVSARATAKHVMEVGKLATHTPLVNISAPHVKAAASAGSAAGLVASKKCAKGRWEDGDYEERHPWG